jgi:hypothetical protein
MAKRREKPSFSQARETGLPPATTELVQDEEGTISAESIPDPDYTTYEDMGSRLTAPVRLPSREAIAVQLGPLNLINRLEEYQSDENWAQFAIGVFFGAILGIVVEWMTSQDMTSQDLEISQSSLVLMALLVVLTIASVLWLRRIRKRKSSLKEELGF